jgi:UDP-N-acetylglucosamine 2-epimerase
METPAFPLYVLIGTKAQYIKMAPLLRRMQETGIAYRLIDTGQHAAISRDLRRELSIKEPDVALRFNGNIKTLVGLIGWSAKTLLTALFRPRRLREEIFGAGRGLCLIHGDTASTLLGLVLAKRARMKVAHVEAGLRSFNPLRPFPEEIIRILCMRFSDYLFAPSEWAAANLAKMKVKGKTINTHQNTNVEALIFALSSKAAHASVTGRYGLMTIHRAETILRRKRLQFVVDALCRAAAKIRVVFVVHDATAKKLEEFGLLARLRETENLLLMGLTGHSAFVNLMANAEFVVTDGGSIQEECAYLNVPCLVLRKETERTEGVGANIRLCPFDRESFDEFVENYPALQGQRSPEDLEPSRRILDAILTEVAV